MLLHLQIKGRLSHGTLLSYFGRIQLQLPCQWHQYLVLSEFHTSMNSKGTNMSPVAWRIFSTLLYTVYLIARCANINPDSTLASLEWSHNFPIEGQFELSVLLYNTSASIWHDFALISLVNIREGRRNTFYVSRSFFIFSVIPPPPTWTEA